MSKSIESTNSNSKPDQAYLELLEKVNFSPIFIIAEHRSGTTLLYKTLVATECFNFVKAYHIIKYDEILSNWINKTENQSIKKLGEELKSLGLNNRVIDDVEVTPDLPEEYGFILKNAGYESHLNPENLHFFEELCKKIQFISAPDKPLLLKNPWCFPHFMYLKNTFPQAKFIFIHRHPIHVINSKLKAARSILSSRNEYTLLLSREYKEILNNPLKTFLFRLFYSSYFNLGLRRVTKEKIEFTNYFLQNIDNLRENDYVSVTYEELCNTPKETIFKILGFLELQPRVNLPYQNLIQPRPLKLLPEVEKKYQKIQQRLKPYFDYHGYV